MLRPMASFSSDELDTYAAVYERDVDLVLVGAARASRSFRAWLLDAVGFPTLDLLRARHSWSTADDRESDVELRFGSEPESYVLQVENKLDAAFQPGQQAAYAERAARLAEDPTVVEARCALLAPEQYARVADSAAFDVVLTYEAVRDVLDGMGPFGRESALILEHAIQKHRRGGAQRPDDPARTEFFRAFSEAAAQAGLPLVPPRPRKANAGFLWWPRAGTLEQPRGWAPRGAHGAWLGAKLVHGSADIELTAIGARCDHGELAHRLRAPNFEVQMSGPSVRIRRGVPVVDPSLPFAAQTADSRANIEGLLELRAWWSATGRAVVEEEIERAASQG